MDRWKVFEHMKQHFTETGTIPGKDEIIGKFAHLPMAEIEEGCAEFDWWVNDRRLQTAGRDHR